jgi:hypothetical protein
MKVLFHATFLPKALILHESQIFTSQYHAICALSFSVCLVDEKRWEKEGKLIPESKTVEFGSKIWP